MSQKCVIPLWTLAYRRLINQPVLQESDGVSGHHHLNVLLPECEDTVWGWSQRPCSVIVITSLVWSLVRLRQIHKIFTIFFHRDKKAGSNPPDRLLFAWGWHRRGEACAVSEILTGHQLSQSCAHRRSEWPCPVTRCQQCSSPHYVVPTRREGSCAQQRMSVGAGAWAQALKHNWEALTLFWAIIWAFFPVSPCWHFY